MKSRIRTLLWALAACLFIVLIWTALSHPEAYSEKQKGYLALWSLGLLLCLILPWLIKSKGELPVSLLVSAGFFAFAADQLIKWLVVCFVRGSPKIVLLPSLFSITYAVNPGAILGILPGHRAVFIASGLLTTIVVFVYYRFVTAEEKITQLCLALVLAGALANMVDRIFLGHVIDMFDLSWQAKSLTIFNLADLFIDGGVLVIALDVLINGMRVPETNEVQPQK